MSLFLCATRLQRTHGVVLSIAYQLEHVKIFGMHMHIAEVSL